MPDRARSLTLVGIVCDLELAPPKPDRIPWCESSSPTVGKLRRLFAARGCIIPRRAS